MENLYAQLDPAFAKVTPETCRKIIAKVRKTEDKFWAEDAKMDKKQENLGQKITQVICKDLYPSF